MKNILIYVVTFLLTLGILIGAIFATSKIKNENIRENMIKSAEYYKDKDPFQFTNGEKFCYLQDNYADAILLGVTWNVKDDDAVSVLDNKYYDGDEEGIAFGLYLDALGEAEGNVDYTRYWHGSMIFIRPLLLFTTVSGVKNIVFGVICFIALILCIILIKKKQYALSGAFALGMVVVKFWGTRLAMEYQSMFVLGLLMCIAYILLEKKGDKALIILSVVSGTMTAFFDFLTTETLTILLPLLMVFVIRESEGRNLPLKKNIIFAVKTGVAWGLSYVVTFLSKWILVSAATGENKITEAITSAEVRINGATAEDLSSIQLLIRAIPANISTMFGGNGRVDAGAIAIGLGLSFIILGSVFYLFRGKEKKKEFIVIALILGGLPYLRYLVLSNHSYLHEFFTFRAQLTTVIALVMIVWFKCDFSVIKKKSKKKGRR